MSGGAAAERSADRGTPGSGPGTAEARALAREIWEGLNREPKRISSRFFYDHRGSELFEEITGLDEYYPTRTETALLREHAGRIVQLSEPASILELGAGSARKTRILLDAWGRETDAGLYLPQDVSAEFVEATARDLRAEYPWLRVTALVGDLRDPVALPPGSGRPLLLCFLGGTLGNFTPAQAVEILGHMAEALAPGDRFLLGLDLRPGGRKTLEELEAAYDDARGVTAEFNLNALRVLNRRVGTDFRLSDFRHRALYREDRGRIEMHLVARHAVEVNVPGEGTVHFAAGDYLRTEISCKYDRSTAADLLGEAGLSLTHWLTDDHDRYALVLGEHA